MIQDVWILYVLRLTLPEFPPILALPDVLTEQCAEVLPGRDRSWRLLWREGLHLRLGMRHRRSSRCGEGNRRQRAEASLFEALRETLDGVLYLDLRAALVEPSSNLHDATGTVDEHQRRICLFDVDEFAFENWRGDFRHLE